MVEIDPITGLPKELSAWENISKQDQQIIVSLEKRKFGKQYTVVKGIDQKSIDVRDLARKLKGKFACGGSHKADMVELQGDHRHGMKDFLVGEGFSEQTITVR